jgi:hypothetical protein
MFLANPSRLGSCSVSVAASDQIAWGFFDGKAFEHQLCAVSSLRVSPVE